MIAVNFHLSGELSRGASKNNAERPHLHLFSGKRASCSSWRPKSSKFIWAIFGSNSTGKHGQSLWVAVANPPSSCSPLDSASSLWIAIHRVSRHVLYKVIFPSYAIVFYQSISLYHPVRLLHAQVTVRRCCFTTQPQLRHVPNYVSK